MFAHKTTATLTATAIAALLAIVAGPSEGSSSLPISTCGQTVTTNAVLVQNLTCAGTGITVGAAGITIDLKGHVLKGDRLSGHYGIYDTHNDVTIENGVVRNFDYGVFVAGPANGVNVSKIVATGNAATGVYVVGAGAKITSSIAAGNGGTGVYVEGGSSSVSSSTAVANGLRGIWLNGAAPAVTASTASGNTGVGIWLEGDSAKVTSATANGNGRLGSPGIDVSGNLASIKSSKASGNGGYGISVSGAGAVLTGNRAEANGFAGGVSDGGGKGILAIGSPAPAGTNNVARGDDDPAGCSPSSLCPAGGSNPKGTPITSCGQIVTGSAFLAQDLDCVGVLGIGVGASGITIDLNGHVLTGNGMPGHEGVYVLGGSDHVTIKNGVVRNFEDGVLAYGADTTVSNVVAVANTHHGIGGDLYAAKIVSSTAAWNGWEGIGAEADKTQVTSSTAVGNGQDGITLEGGGNSVKSSSAVANNPSGIHLEGDSTSVASSTAFGNALYGVYVEGNSAAVKSTTTAGNASHGIAVLGDAAALSSNRANGNGLPSGVSDGFGMGIFAGGFTVAPAGTNIALGNDDPTGCDPSALC